MWYTFLTQADRLQRFTGPSAKPNQWVLGPCWDLIQKKTNTENPEKQHLKMSSGLHKCIVQVHAHTLIPSHTDINIDILSTYKVYNILHIINLLPL